MKTEYARKVYFHDTDQAAVVHHSNYLKYFEEARIEHLKQHGQDYKTLQAQKIGLAPVDIQIKYHHPLRLEDEATIMSEVIEKKRATVVFQQELYRENKLICSATVTLACLDESKFKPIRLPDSIASL